MPALSDDRVWFVAERFEQLRDLLLEFGYALDPGPAIPTSGTSSTTRSRRPASFG